MENMQTTDVSVNNGYSLGWLVRHIWKVIILKTWSRVSRGEYFLASGFLGIVSTIIMIVLMWLYRLLVGEAAPTGSISVFWIILFLIQIGFIIWWLILWTRRLKDLNMSPWWMLVVMSPLIWLVVFAMIWYNSIYSMTGSYEIWSNNIIIIWVLSIVSVVLALIMIFKKWTTWPNKYGSDPLDHQPRSNKNYWLLFLGVIIINIVLPSVSWLNDSLERAMLRGMGIDPAEIDRIQNMDLDMRDLGGEIEDNTLPVDDTLDTIDNTVVDETNTDELVDPIVDQDLSEDIVEETTSDDSAVIMDETTPVEDVPSNPSWDDSTVVDPA